MQLKSWISAIAATVVVATTLPSAVQGQKATVTADCKAFYEGVTYVGSTITNVGNNGSDSPADCLAACRSAKTCVAYTHVEGIAQYGIPNKCYLFATAQGTRSSTTNPMVTSCAIKR